MKLVTSYFAMMKLFNRNVIPISICGWPPKWYNGLQYKALAPKWSTLSAYKEDNDWDKYTKEYKETVLAGKDPQSVLNDLKNIALTQVDDLDNAVIALLCFERAGNNCHRHIVSEWFRNNGIPCSEMLDC